MAQPPVNTLPNTPTFENVITNTSSQTVPKLAAHSCNFGLTGVVKRRELLRSIGLSVAEITGFPEAEIAAQGIVEQLLKNSRSAPDLKTQIEKLAKGKT